MSSYRKVAVCLNDSGSSTCSIQQVPSQLRGRASWRRKGGICWYMLLMLQIVSLPLESNDGKFEQAVVLFFLIGDNTTPHVNLPGSWPASAQSFGNRTGIVGFQRVQRTPTDLQSSGESVRTWNKCEECWRPIRFKPCFRSNVGDRGLEERQDETRVDDRPESLVQHLKKIFKSCC